MQSELTNIARNLRKRSTEAESLLWRHLRAKRLEGLRFRRQQPIGNYVVDVICFEKGVVIEVDGGQHVTEIEKDSNRDKWFKEQGFKVLRFWNNEILSNTSGVLEVIRGNCLNHSFCHPHPSLPPSRGKESGDVVKCIMKVRIRPEIDK